MTRIAVVTAGLSQPSSSRLLADQLSAAAARSLEARGQSVAVDVIELRPLAHDLADKMLTGFAAGELEKALATVSDADADIAVSPVFPASYSGLVTLFFRPNQKDAPGGTPAAVRTTSGAARHPLV